MNFTDMFSCLEKLSQPPIFKSKMAVGQGFEPRVRY
jgi:hypothetical protein